MSESPVRKELFNGKGRQVNTRRHNRVVSWSTYFGGQQRVGTFPEPKNTLYPFFWTSIKRTQKVVVLHREDTLFPFTLLFCVPVTEIPSVTFSLQD